MIFNSYAFLAFFPIVTLAYYLMPMRARRPWLLAASYYFYMCWNAQYALLIAASTLVTYLCALALGRMEAKAGRRAVLALGLAINLGILCFFKYFGFFTDTFARIAARLGVRLAIPAFDVLLPVGISFYTFQALSYTMDVYRGQVEVERNFFRYALFVSFFPQLVAGPIERSRDLLGQLRQPRPFDPDAFKNGALMMLWGYFQKMVVADRAALLVNQVYGNSQAYAGYSIAVATVAFALQIYCDFGGYSSIALGAAQMLGINLTQNFRQPYLATSVSDFWRRWHISLSTWFRDYLYIPLGGSRVGRIRRYFNVMITFLLSGLWHGANWTYVIWGGLNGLFQIAGNVKNTLLSHLPATLKDGRPVVNRDCFSYRLFQRLMTFALICLTWVFFRAESLEAAMIVLRQMFSVHNPWIFFDETLYTLGLSRLELGLLVASAAVVLAVDVAHEHGVTLRKRLERQNLAFRWLAYLAAILCILIFGVYGPGFDASQFIYFQF